MTEQHSSKENISNNPVAKHLLRAETVHVFPTDARLSFLHPTTIEMVKKMLKSGRLLDRSSNIPVNDNDVTGLVTPSFRKKIPSVFLNESINQLLDEPERLRDAAIYSANSQAEEHFFLAQLGLPFDNQQIADQVGEYLSITDPDAVDFVDHIFESDKESRGREIAAAMDLLPFLRPEFINLVPETIAKARERKGFLIGVNASPVPDTNLRIVGKVAENDDHIRFSFGQEGIPYTAIVAIEPLGPQEEQFLNDLRGAQ